MIAISVFVDLGLLAIYLYDENSEFNGDRLN